MFVIVIVFSFVTILVDENKKFCLEVNTGTFKGKKVYLFGRGANEHI